MIRMRGEPDDATTVEITEQALDHFKRIYKLEGFWLGVIVGIVAGVGFMLIK